MSARPGCSLKTGTVAGGADPDATQPYEVTPGSVLGQSKIIEHVLALNRWNCLLNWIRLNTEQAKKKVQTAEKFDVRYDFLVRGLGVGHYEGA